jgi:DsbC/DsbD-like thiol-disulfide interchange protein
MAWYGIWSMVMVPHLHCCDNVCVDHITKLAFLLGCEPTPVDDLHLFDYSALPTFPRPAVQAHRHSIRSGFAAGGWGK